MTETKEKKLQSLHRTPTTWSLSEPSIVLFRVRHVLPVVSFNPNSRSPQPASGLPNRRPPSAFNLLIHLPIYRHHQWCMRFFNASHFFPDVSFHLTRLYGPLPTIVSSCIKGSLGPKASSLPLPRPHLLSIPCKLSSF